MEAAVKNKFATKFVVQHPSGCTEQHVEEEKMELLRRKIQKDVHNLRSKVANALLGDLRAVLAEAVSPEFKAMVRNCSSFHDIVKLFATLRKGTATYASLVAAAERFCSIHKFAYGFWAESNELDKLSNDRNKETHCNVSESAAALCSRNLGEEFPEFEPADAIIDALAKYAEKHGERLDAAYEEERQHIFRAKRELKKLRAEKSRPVNL